VGKGHGEESGLKNLPSLQNDAANRANIEVGGMETLLKSKKAKSAIRQRNMRRFTK